jgi:hypothetical protein
MLHQEWAGDPIDKIVIVELRPEKRAAGSDGIVPELAKYSESSLGTIV